jgi:hypothetical protein
MKKIWLCGSGGLSTAERRPETTVTSDGYSALLTNHDFLMVGVYVETMQIASTHKPQVTRATASVSQPATQPATPPTEPQDGWVGATLSVAGGVATLAGAMTGQPLLAAGGAFSTAVGTAMTASRVQDSGMDTAAWVSFGVGGGLMALGALTMMSPAPQPAGPQGPLPTFLREIGVQALPF